MKLFCSGRGNVVALNWHAKSSLISDCVYWKDKGVVEVPPEGKAMCVSAPRRVELAPGAYTIAALERGIEELLEQQHHLPSPGHTHTHTHTHASRSWLSSSSI